MANFTVDSLNSVSLFKILSVVSVVLDINATINNTYILQLPFEGRKSAIFVE